MDEKKFSYLDYLKEIYAVAGAIPCHPTEAWDRFRFDVRNERCTDNTAGILDDFDFAAVGKVWNSMTEDEQQAARDEWYDFRDKMRAEK